MAPHGTTSNADLGTVASNSCFDDSEQLPEVGDNEKARGLVILDVETDEWTLIFTDNNLNAGGNGNTSPPRPAAASTGPGAFWRPYQQGPNLPQGHRLARDGNGI